MNAWEQQDYYTIDWEGIHEAIIVLVFPLPIGIGRKGGWIGAGL